jgi:hypothetical protein
MIENISKFLQIISLLSESTHGLKTMMSHQKTHLKDYDSKKSSFQLMIYLPNIIKLKESLWEVRIIMHTYQS